MDLNTIKKPASERKPEVHYFSERPSMDGARPMQGKKTEMLFRAIAFMSFRNCIEDIRHDSAPSFCP